MTLTPAASPTGHWAASAGLVQTGDGDAPITGSLGFEATGWYVLSPKWDLGFRLQSLSFSSDGLQEGAAPWLMPGDGSVLLGSAVLRWYPLGSELIFFPFVGVSVGTPLSDSFDAERQIVPGVGFTLDTDWSIDSTGIGAELGLRYDLADGRWFVEVATRYQSLGATSRGTLEVPPTISRSRQWTTNLDSLHFAFLIGHYF
ncbi:MAG TPA: hypothetical protein ENK10_05045 [Acidobacteria bacterium]|nr:hypothetical protein [Acidobacteriota bacterium]